MKIGPMFKWFGSKWRSSKHYPKPKHDLVYEPFAGGAGYALRHYEREVVLYDLNPMVGELWNYLIKADPNEIMAIPVEIDIGTDIRTLGLNRGQALLLKSWQRTRSDGECWTISKWGHLPGQWTNNARERVAHCVGLIRHWRFGTLESSEPATRFIDPPYQYNDGYGMPKIDYSALAKRILASKGQIIVCEATCPKTGKVPNWLPFTPFRKVITTRRGYSNELLYEVDL